VENVGPLMGNGKAVVGPHVLRAARAIPTGICALGMGRARRGSARHCRVDGGPDCFGGPATRLRGPAWSSGQSRGFHRPTLAPGGLPEAAYVRGGAALHTVGVDGRVSARRRWETRGPRASAREGDAPAQEFVTTSPGRRPAGVRQRSLPARPSRTGRRTPSLSGATSSREAVRTWESRAVASPAQGKSGPGELGGGLGRLRVRTWMGAWISPRWHAAGPVAAEGADPEIVDGGQRHLRGWGRRAQERLGDVVASWRNLEFTCVGRRGFRGPRGGGARGRPAGGGWKTTVLQH